MNNQEESNSNLQDEHDHDAVMPGFRFHPTEEELVEFYLRRKVEGKRFNLELITLLDLYRYDPWELPGLAAIGEKEWYFYVPRDKKYRNGDRPNRVTTSGYWKATGADRIIRSESRRSIGLKKTLVFYSGRAPRGVRTSWIMNEYRLPLHETQLLQKAEISLCRVHKRAGIKDLPSLPRSLTSPPPSSSRRRPHEVPATAPLEDGDKMALLQFPCTSSSSHEYDLHKLVNINFSVDTSSLASLVQYQHHTISATTFVSYFPSMQPPPQPHLVVAPSIVPAAASPERLMFDWNAAISEASKDDFTNIF